VGWQFLQPGPSGYPRDPIRDVRGKKNVRGEDQKVMSLGSKSILPQCQVEWLKFQPFFCGVGRGRARRLFQRTAAQVAYPPAGWLCLALDTPDLYLGLRAAIEHACFEESPLFSGATNESVVRAAGVSPPPRRSGVRLVVDHFPKSCGPPEYHLRSIHGLKRSRRLLERTWWTEEAVWGCTELARGPVAKLERREM